MSSNDFYNEMAKWRRESDAREQEAAALHRLRMQRQAAQEIRALNEAQQPPKKPLKRIRAPSGKVYTAEYDD